MRDALGPGTVLGYCTNVHAGSTLDATRHNLETHACAVRDRVSPDAPMGIGLWLSADAAASLEDDPRSLHEFRSWLDDAGLEVFTINGFPYSDFHQARVKHLVYEPDWSCADRERYTARLVRLIAALAEPGQQRSISTLPLGWRARHPRWTEPEGAAAFAARFAAVIAQCADVEAATDVMVHVDIEPEPGCCLDTAADVVAFFRILDQHTGLGRELIRRHVRVCHDVCHAAVMFDDQARMFERYRADDIRIGKVQVSSAVRADLRGLPHDDAADALRQLSEFGEDRYLHQTVVHDGTAGTFYEDLPDALTQHPPRDTDEWRVHFHVPVYLDRFERLGTTREAVIECVDLLQGTDVAHWEVETYAWSVLPVALRHEVLADGIARELQWFGGLAGGTQ